MPWYWVTPRVRLVTAILALLSLGRLIIVHLQLLFLHYYFSQAQCAYYLSGHNEGLILVNRRGVGVSNGRGTIALISILHDPCMAVISFFHRPINHSWSII